MYPLQPKKYMMLVPSRAFVILEPTIRADRFAFNLAQPMIGISQTIHENVIGKY
jgi:hypothetical protein